MLYFNQRIPADTIAKIEEKALCDLVAGVTLTKFVSEGSDFEGIPPCSAKEILDACSNYWDERDGVLVTETTPDFRTTNGVIYI